jgi:hypothetical protein
MDTQLESFRQNRTGKTGHPEEDRQEQEAERDRQKITGGKGHAEKDRRIRTGKTGKAE